MSTRSADKALLDHWREWEFVLWKAGMLAGLIFAFYCHERQFVELGEVMLRPSGD